MIRLVFSLIDQSRLSRTSVEIVESPAGNFLVVCFSCFAVSQTMITVLINATRARLYHPSGKLERAPRPNSSQGSPGNYSDVRRMLPGKT